MESTDSQRQFAKWVHAQQEDSPLALNTKRWRLWLILFLLVLGGGGLWYRLQAGQGSPPAANEPQGPPPRAVQTVKLQAGQGAQQVQLLGEVTASKSATLRSQTSGVVQQLFVSEGDRVQAGQVIAILDSAEQRLALAEAQAELAEAKSNLANLERGTRPEVLDQRQAAVQAAKAQENQALDNLDRTEALVKEGALSTRSLIEARAEASTARQNRLAASAELAEAKAGPLAEEIEAQQANVAAAQAAVNQRSLTLQRTQIRSISDGIVRSREVSVGDYAENADEIITLVDSDVVDIFLEVREALGGQIRPGLPVTLRSRPLPQWKATATISGIVPVADNQSRRQLVRVRLNNPPPELLPGMAVQAALELPTRSVNGYVVSRDALTRQNDQWLVFRVNQGQAKQVPVELVSDMGETVVIQSNQLSPNAEIVLKGGDMLQDGAPVMVVNGQNNPSPKRSIVN